eukprot:scaffold76841_cov69-Phaeocystis_antarctica.AAC.12
MPEARDMPEAREVPCLHLSYTSIDATDPFAHCCHADRRRRWLKRETSRDTGSRTTSRNFETVRSAAVIKPKTRLAVFEAEDRSEVLPSELGGVSVCQHVRLLVIPVPDIAPTARAVPHEHREHRTRASLLSPDQVDLWHAATTDLAAHGRA